MALKSKLHWYVFVYVIILGLGLMVVGFLSLFGIFTGPLYFFGGTGVVFAIALVLELDCEENHEQCATARGGHS